MARGAAGRWHPIWRSVLRRWSPWLLRLVLILALVVGLGVGSPLSLPQLAREARADSPQPVSGAFSLGGGLSGSVDERTGQFSISVPLVSVQSVGDTSIQFTLSWVQSRASAGVDRMGMGGGWSLGSSFVDANGGVTVYPASGGRYELETDNLDQFPSGLTNYVLQDLTFEVVDDDPPPTLPARAGVPDPVAYAYTLNYDDGKVDYFDANGNLVVRADRFGNRTDISYEQAGTSPNGDLQWQPTAIIDGYGLAYTFDYGSNDAGVAQLTVSSPERSDGKTAQTVVLFGGAGGVSSITDPVGRETNFGYQEVNGVQLVDLVEGPTGAQTQVSYESYTFPAVGDPVVTVVVADTLSVLASDGVTQLSPERSFDLDPDGNTDQHNYAGNGSGTSYLSASEDLLFASGDPSYTYTTEISTAATSTLSTYDSAHRLIERTVQLIADSGDPVVVQDQLLCYPDLVDIGQGVVPPANYTNPTNIRLAHYSSSGPNGPQGPATADGPDQSEWCADPTSDSDSDGGSRVVTSSHQFDSHGRMQQVTDESGVTTTTTYDPAFGLPTTVVTAQGSTVLRRVEATLTDDDKSIHTVTQSDADGSGKLSARSTRTYTYDDAGRPQSQTIAWAAGAAPPDNGGGPASTTTSYTSTFDGPVRTIEMTSGVGTPEATTTSTDIDLVSGQVVRSVDGAGRVTTTTYDEANRTLSVTPPTGMTTKTSYQNAEDAGSGFASKTVTRADGHVTTTTYDALSRVATVTDNIKNGAFVADSGTRTVSTLSYSTDGSTITATDKLGRTTTTTSDAVGRVVSQVGPTGVTSTTTYNDVDNTTTERVYAVGASTPSEITGTARDELNRVVSSRTTYPVTSRTNLVDPARLTSYDGLGRITSLTTNDMTAVPDFAGAGGVPVTTTISPAKTARNSATPVLATDTTRLSGDITKRSLAYTSGDQQAASAPQVVVDAVGNTTTETDGLGQQTGYQYAGDGRPIQRTDPDGTVSTRTYDSSTGQLTKISSTAKDGTAVTTTYTYVPAGQVGAGLVKTATNESGTITYGYDADRNRTSVGYPDGSSVSYDYADNGQLQTMTDITGAVTTYAYNDDGTMKSATQVRGSATLASVSYGYDALRRVKTITRGNGLVTTHTYTPNNLLATQTTVDKNANQIEAHSYSYDNHHNLTKRTDTTAKPSSCVVLCTTGASTYGTYTTTYGYDAYDRLTGSAVYSGTTTTGTPVTKLDYALDVSGNITTTTRTTNLATGTRKTLTVQTTTNTFDDASQLTGQTVGSTSRQQTHDPQGRVTTSLSGSTTTYRPDGLPATVAVGGATTTFSYWPDGTRSRAVTTGGSAGTTTVDYHYGVDRTLVNDTTTQAGTSSNTGVASASYLVTGGREARTILPSTTAGGAAVAGAQAEPQSKKTQSKKTQSAQTTAKSKSKKSKKKSKAAKPKSKKKATAKPKTTKPKADATTSAPAAPVSAAPVTTGSGVGYLLRDRHSSVTAVVDSTGAVTNTYAYSDWGAPALLDGRVGSVSGAAAGIAPGTTNPLQYAGAAAHAMYTDSGLGTMMLPARFYDPNQARFTSRDVADAHNLYLGFDGNPIMNLDPTGQDAATDTILDILYVGIFLVSAILSGGAAVAAWGAAAAATELTAALIVPVVASVVATAANVAGMAVSLTRFADDEEPAGKKFLTDDQRNNLSNISTILGSVAGVAGGVADFAATGAEAAADAAGSADTMLADTDFDEPSLDADDDSVPSNSRSFEADEAASEGDEPTNLTNTKSTTPSNAAPDEERLPTIADSESKAKPATDTLKKARTGSNVTEAAASVSKTVFDQIEKSDSALAQVRPKKPEESEVETTHRWRGEDDSKGKGRDTVSQLMTRNRSGSHRFNNASSASDD